MKFLLRALLTLIFAMPSISSANTKHSVRILHTTDVHGNFFPYNYVTRQPWQGSMARVATYVDSLRTEVGSDKVVLLENGDILQGQPTAYYYNYIDTHSPHLAAEILKYMSYDAATLGNHDIETGHVVYDRYLSELTCPVLGANIIDINTGAPYVAPYTILNKNGIKIAVLGLITPAIPAWLPENLWSGLKFEDMIESARKWVPEIISKEQPDVIVGLFHSGHDSTTRTGGIMENASEALAQQVGGFDVIMIGHDHQSYNKTVEDPEGKQVLIINPANNALKVSDVEITVTKDPEGKVIDKNITGHLADVSKLAPHKEFMTRFLPMADSVNSFVGRKIGKASGDFTSRDAFFGPSAFMSLLHRLQLEISGADISFAAPLSFDACISEGDIRVSDMFSLYKYENLLYTMEMTGREIKNYLEMSYNLWTDSVGEDGSGHIIRFASEKPTLSDNRLKYPSYNFDSAAGINYSVDITRPKGEKITIHAMTDGRPFELDKTYRVAVNSYRGNGGGDLLTKGAGIAGEELSKRIVNSTEKDLRYYLLKAVEAEGVIEPIVESNWKFEPEELATKAIERDRKLLFSGSTLHQK